MLTLGARVEPTGPWHDLVGRFQVFDPDAYARRASTRLSILTRLRDCFTAATQACPKMDSSPTGTTWPAGLDLRGT